jgi:transcriptional repressor NrdR
MRCPECDGTENKVVDTRTSRGGRAVRRRRECLECAERFTTYEYVEARPIQVLKADGSAQEFDREKLIRSLRIACAKRPVSASDMERLVDEIEDDLSKQAGVEVASDFLGALIMDRLKPLDRVAYVRFASVYRNFEDIDEFQDMVDELHTRQQQDAVALEQENLEL